MGKRPGDIGCLFCMWFLGSISGATWPPEDHHIWSLVISGTLESKCITLLIFPIDPWPGWLRIIALPLPLKKGLGVKEVITYYNAFKASYAMLSENGSKYTLILIYFFYLGPHPMVLMAYFCLCTQGSLLIWGAEKWFPVIHFPGKCFDFCAIYLQP